MKKRDAVKIGQAIIDTPKPASVEVVFDSARREWAVKVLDADGKTLAVDYRQHREQARGLAAVLRTEHFK